jgi:hypothetical protein
MAKGRGCAVSARQANAVRRTLRVTHNDGSTEQVRIWCGSNYAARRLPARIGRALVAGTATAVLDYDGLQRTAIRGEINGEYYTRVVR